MGMFRRAGVATPALAIFLATPTTMLAALMMELLCLDRDEYSEPVHLELVLPEEDLWSASTTMTTSEEFVDARVGGV